MFISRDQTRLNNNLKPLFIVEMEKIICTVFLKLLYHSTYIGLFYINRYANFSKLIIALIKKKL